MKAHYLVDLFADRGDYDHPREVMQRVAKDIAAAINRSPAALKGIGEECTAKLTNWYEAAGRRMGDDNPDVYAGYQLNLLDKQTVQLKVLAEGEDVFFLEFGIGDDTYPGGGDFAEQSGVDVSPGSWSRAHNGPYSRHGHWHYSKRFYYGERGKGKKYKPAEIRRRSKNYTGVAGAHAMFKAMQYAEKVTVARLNKL